MSVLFPDPETPRHRGHRAERDLDVDALEVVLARAGQRDPARTETAALARNRNLLRAGEIRAGERTFGDA